MDSRAVSQQRPKRAEPPHSTEQQVFDALCAGYRRREPRRIVDLYADDAEVTIINRNNPPSKRLILRGREALQRMYEDLCAREMTHRLECAAVTAGMIAYSVHCHYPDGCDVIGMNHATVVDGRIVRELNLSCWDE